VLLSSPACREFLLVIRLESSLSAHRRPGFFHQVVFHASTAGRIENHKKLVLDPSEHLTEIKTISIQDWS
jgi:hypothetical protein